MQEKHKIVKLLQHKGLSEIEANRMLSEYAKKHFRGVHSLNKIADHASKPLNFPKLLNIVSEHHHVFFIKNPKPKPEYLEYGQDDVAFI
jgi:hypothetical protein